MQVLGGSPKLSDSGLAFFMTNLCSEFFSFIKKNISTSLGVCSSTMCTKFNVQIGAGRHVSFMLTLKGIGLTPLIALI